MNKDSQDNTDYDLDCYLNKVKAELDKIDFGIIKLKRIENKIDGIEKTICINELKTLISNKNSIEIYIDNLNIEKVNLDKVKTDIEEKRNKLNNFYEDTKIRYF